MLSRSVHDQVHNKLELTLADLGEVEVKNIARPVHAFQVLREGESPVRLAKQGLRWPKLAAAAVVAMLIAGGLWWHSQKPNGGDADSGSLTTQLAGKPSIAVLPFQDLSEGKVQTWFGDGMTEDIITDLSKISGLFVIARNSSFQYRGGSHDLQEVGRELGVAFLL